MFTYRAEVLRVIDGDTVILDIDLGFSTWLCKQSVRLVGCNARELKDPGGAEAREHLSAMLPDGLAVTVTTVKPDKFGGRYDARVILPDGRDVTSLLIAQGWAALWDGRGVRPIPPWPRREVAPPTD